MTEETQALVDRLLGVTHHVHCPHSPSAEDAAEQTIRDAAAALTALARDLATARGLLGRDLAQARDRNVELEIENQRLTAAVRAARAETDKAVDVVSRYAKHPPSCPKGVGVGFYKPPAGAACDCGIDAVLASAAREGQ